MLTQLVNNALRTACRGLSGLTHAQRSAAWIQALTHQLHENCEMYAPRDRLAAFCRADDTNRSEFRTNELLFDVLVAETRQVRAVKGKELSALARVLWVVESELKRSDSRDVLIDLNKLVVAKSVNKVLVVSASTPLVDWVKAVMENLLDPNECNVYLVTIPHPDGWCESFEQLGTVYQLSSERSWLTT